MIPVCPAKNEIFDKKKMQYKISISYDKYL